MNTFVPDDNLIFLIFLWFIFFTFFLFDFILSACFLLKSFKKF